MGPSLVASREMPEAFLPPEARRPGSSSWARRKDLCAPAGTPVNPPDAWSATTCNCQRHKGKPSVEYLRALLQQNPERQQAIMGAAPGA